jgi:hypothetical protein
MGSPLTPLFVMLSWTKIDHGSFRCDDAYLMCGQSRVGAKVANDNYPQPHNRSVSR